MIRFLSRKTILCCMVPEGGSQKKVMMRKKKINAKRGDDYIVKAGHQGETILSELLFLTK